MNPEDLSSLITSNPVPVPTSSPLDLMDYYNDSLSSALDTMAPLKTQTVSFNHTAPWYTPELHQLKDLGLHLERLCTKT